MSLLKALVILFSFLMYHRIHTLDFQAKCPHLFLYEGKCIDADRWYGVIALPPNTASHNVSFRLILDRPAAQIVIVNLLKASISTRDNQEFLVKVPACPQIIRFYVRYNPNEPAPNLTAFRINEKTVCPDVTVKKQLRTSPPRKDITLNVVNKDKTILSPSPSSSNKIDSDDICGTTAVQPKRLLHGETSYEGQFPWHAALSRISSKGEQYHLCGASLISKDHVLTAAHCVINPGSRVPIERMALEVYIGTYYPKRFYNYNLQRRGTLKITIHPQYHPLNSTNDIAIVKLIAPVDITDYVRPVCLWEDSVDLKPIVDKQGTVVGWSYNEIVEVTEQVTHVEMPIVSQEICTSFYADFYSDPASRGTYCAGELNDTKICGILSAGNGMVFPTSDSNQQNPRWQLRGLVSLTGSSDVRCNPSFYTVFTDVAAHLDWIRRSLQ